MFTGIVEEIGHIKSIQRSGQGSTISINCSKVLEDVKVGDSIASNGVCLTVTSFDEYSFQADLMPETNTLSNFNKAKVNDLVNLERALKASDRFGGHMVSGHIDGLARVHQIKSVDNAVIFSFSCDKIIERYIVKKGSITVNGLSLTVVDQFAGFFSVSLIPQSLRESNMSEVRVGDMVNIETDIVGRYIEKFMVKEEKINKNYLQEHGFL